MQVKYKVAISAASEEYFFASLIREKLLENNPQLKKENIFFHGDDDIADKVSSENPSVLVEVFRKDCDIPVFICSYYSLQEGSYCNYEMDGAIKRIDEKGNSKANTLLLLINDNELLENVGNNHYETLRTHHLHPNNLLQASKIEFKSCIPDCEVEKQNKCNKIVCYQKMADKAVKSIQVKLNENEEEHKQIRKNNDRTFKKKAKDISAADLLEDRVNIFYEDFYYPIPLNENETVDDKLYSYKLKNRNCIITGLSASGKSRTIYELLHRKSNAGIKVLSDEPVYIAPKKLDRFDTNDFSEGTIFILNDIDKYENKVVIKDIIKKTASNKYFLVATCRSSKLNQVESLIESLSKIVIPTSLPYDDIKKQVENLKKQNPEFEINEDSYDGKVIGSLFYSSDILKEYKKHIVNSYNSNDRASIIKGEIIRNYFVCGLLSKQELGAEKTIKDYCKKRLEDYHEQDFLKNKEFDTAIHTLSDKQLPLITIENDFICIDDYCLSKIEEYVLNTPQYSFQRICNEIIKYKGGELWLYAKLIRKAGYYNKLDVVKNIFDAAVSNSEKFSQYDLVSIYNSMMFVSGEKRKCINYFEELKISVSDQSLYSIFTYKTLIHYEDDFDKVVDYILEIKNIENKNLEDDDILTPFKVLLFTINKKLLKEGAWHPDREKENTYRVALKKRDILPQFVDIDNASIVYINYFLFAHIGIYATIEQLNHDLYRSVKDWNEASSLYENSDKILKVTGIIDDYTFSGLLKHSPNYNTTIDLLDEARKEEMINVRFYNAAFYSLYNNQFHIAKKLWGKLKEEKDIEPDITTYSLYISKAGLSFYDAKELLEELPIIPESKLYTAVIKRANQIEDVLDLIKNNCIPKDKLDVFHFNAALSIKVNNEKNKKRELNHREKIEIFNIFTENFKIDPNKDIYNNLIKTAPEVKIDEYWDKIKLHDSYSYSGYISNNCVTRKNAEKRKNEALNDENIPFHDKSYIWGAFLQKPVTIEEKIDLIQKTPDAQNIPILGNLMSKENKMDFESVKKIFELILTLKHLTPNRIIFKNLLERANRVKDYMYLIEHNDKFSPGTIKQILNEILKNAKTTLNDAEKLYVECKKNDELKTQIDSYTYSILLSKCGDYENSRAKKIIDEAIVSKMLNSWVFNNYLLVSPSPSKIYKKFEKMGIISQIQPDTRTYNIILKQSKKEINYEQASEYVKLIKKPDSYTYTYYLGYAQTANEALDIYSKISYPDIYNFNTLIGMCESSEFSKLESILLKNEDLKPNFTTYNLLLKIAPSVDELNKIWLKLNENFQPNSNSFSNYIINKSICDEIAIQKHKEAEEYYNDDKLSEKEFSIITLKVLQQVNFERSPEIFRNSTIPVNEIIIGELVNKSPNVNFAVDVIKLEEHDIPPNDVVFKLLLAKADNKKDIDIILDLMSKFWHKKDKIEDTKYRFGQLVYTIKGVNNRYYFFKEVCKRLDYPNEITVYLLRFIISQEDNIDYCGKILADFSDDLENVQNRELYIEIFKLILTSKRFAIIQRHNFLKRRINFNKEKDLFLYLLRIAISKEDNIKNCSKIVYSYAKKPKTSKNNELYKEVFDIILSNRRYKISEKYNFLESEVNTYKNNELFINLLKTIIYSELNIINYECILNIYSSELVNKGNYRMYIRIIELILSNKNIDKQVRRKFLNRTKLSPAKKKELHYGLAY
ncbi:MAG: hypothetical protein GQ564_09330 [Bacteroidales bacterium]|nr:hypothetical protein [Bacteroidales bacterium]